MNVLLLATRDPGGRQSGRKAVINTAIDSLVGLGHEVDVVVFSKTGSHSADAERPRVRFHDVPTPGVARVGVNVALHASRARMCLNEALYYSPSAAARVAGIARDARSDVVVADMIRTVPLASRTDLPLIVDLDDLLSRRLRRMAVAGGDRRDVLGYFGEQLDDRVARPLAWAASKACRWEAGLLERREVEVVMQASAVSLVSEAEAERLRRRTGRPVAALPMGVDLAPLPADPAASPADSLVFLGGLDYFANVQGLRWFASSVLPALRGNGLPDLRLTVVGHCPPSRREEFRVPGVELRGYADDLGEALRAHRAFVAPVVSGTGVKTKVLTAMAHGLPVVSTTLGVEGTGALPGRDCLVADDAPAFAAQVEVLARDPRRAAAIGAAGRRLVSERFSSVIVSNAWASVLASAR